MKRQALIDRKLFASRKHKVFNSVNQKVINIPIKIEHIFYKERYTNKRSESLGKYKLKPQ